MFRALLPAALFLLWVGSGHAAAQSLVEGGAHTAGQEKMPPCENTMAGDNCARVLACIGGDGLWFDGQARGWGKGIILGAMSDGTPCTGSWRYREGVNIATASLSCEDGTKGKVIYYSQDNLTGTGIGRGLDSRLRGLRVWSGHNVLEFLTPKDGPGALLPCTGEPIPIS